MSRDAERQLLEWLAANQPRFVAYAMSIGAAYSLALISWCRQGGGEFPLTLGQFRRVARYAHTTGYLTEWHGAPPTVKADARGQQFFEFVAA